MIKGRGGDMPDRPGPDRLGKGRGPRMYEMQGPRSALPRLANRLLGCPALPGRPPLLDARPKRRPPGSPAVSWSRPRDRYPSLVVCEFLQRHADLAQGLCRSNFKILWPSTGHLELSPALRSISTALSTTSSTARGIRRRGDEPGRRAAVVRRPAGTSCGDRPDQLLSSSSRRPKLPNSRWPAPAAVSATPRTAPMSGSADRFHESW
jgi:hypothetical protein